MDLSIKEQEKVLDFGKNYRMKSEEVRVLKDKLDSIKEKINICLNELENLRSEERRFLLDIQDKYRLSDQEIIQIVQKIVIANG